ncbi:family 20 glycosylhydrolase [Ruthenibacterium lactatiformans]|uniref:family 20 glycosylhydrolase n=1 Tax=Ruthenibacterium lactatiformans TaxID=1550024 RepID=UPI003FD85450
MKTVLLEGDAPAVEAARMLAGELGFAPGGGPQALVLTLRADEAAGALRVRRSGRQAEVSGRLCDIGRGLSLLAQHGAEQAFCIEQTPCFARCGVMLDVSRNAVLKPDAVRYYLRRMAAMGLNTAMLYTEDTYEVPGEPWFGYMRGAYSHSELRALDDYAAALGIELVPCIQTLGHLERVLHWSAMEKYRDTPGVLLAESEETYALLERMIEAASAPLRSRRIHIGMDEAWGLGTGRYRSLVGDAPGHEIMARHLARVREILNRHGLHGMMWSDMYFRLASPQQAYYDLSCPVPPEVTAAAPADVDLVYWDYYNEDAAFYRAFLQRHAQFAARTVFAGGIWTWAGPAVHYEKSFAASVPALEECRRAGVDEVFLTAWGDNGAECNLLAALYGMQLYAEFCYTGACDRQALAERFAVCTGAQAADFEAMTAFHRIPGVRDAAQSPANPGRTLLYQDPLLPLCEADYAGVDVAGHYKALAARYAAPAACPPVMEPMFAFYRELARVLWRTAEWHAGAAPCVRAGDRDGARRLCACVPEICASIEALRAAARTLWFSTNRPFGFEVIDIRLGGLAARYASAGVRMEQFARGEVDTIEELAAPKLPLYRRADGCVETCYEWAAVVSACRI